jgi:Zn-dependent peptidase ImmA (M78 family)
MQTVNKSRELAIRALRAAAETRRKGHVSRDSPICIFDLAERLEVEVRFVDAPSLEGMYSHSETGTILLPSLHHRPPGRLAFSCAHELGHHIFGHGTRVDEYLRKQSRRRVTDPEEWLADCYAGYLLMPRSAVLDCFQRRGLSICNATEIDIYIIAGELGVGYRTLISHLRWSLRLLPSDRARMLARSTPKAIRAELLRECRYRHLTVVDSTWKSKAIAVDLRFGDAAIFPAGTRIDGQSVRISKNTETGVVVEGIQVGRSRAILANDDQAVFIRVSKADYVGRSIFRHLEDPDEHR